MSQSVSVGTLRVGFIGAGRVGAVLARCLLDAGYQIAAIAGESDASRQRAASLLPGVLISKPSAVARSCEILFLTVPDDMVANVVTVLSDSGAITAAHTVIHTSGRHGLAVLEPAARVGAKTLALHPAMTFSGTEIDLGRLDGCVFGVTAQPEDRNFAETLVADLGGQLMWVEEAMRGLYHAALAHGANHLVTLVSQAMEMLSAAGSEDPAATLRPLLTAALDNSLNHSDSALTGPIVRGDVLTVQAHIDELVRHAPHTLASYVALANATLDRVITDGRVLPIRAERIRAVLNGSLQRVSTQ